MTDPLLLELPAEIETPRLRMRPPRAGDGPAMREALIETLPELRRFLGWLPIVAGGQAPEEFEAWCRKAQANFLTRVDLPFLVFEQAGGKLVGVTGLHRPVWATPKAEIGYWVRTPDAGRGYVTESVQALCAYAVRHFGAVRLEAIMDEENVASRRVAERCGFTLEGLLRHERRAPDGSLRNTCIYARLEGAGS